MVREQQSRGTCSYCGAAIAKGSMRKHLGSCAARKEAIERVEKKSGTDELLYHLRIQSSELGQFWLDLEMRGSATLQHLDGYLRAIWLECCGHMSQFTTGGWQGKELSMALQADKVFEPGVTLTHFYDMGSTSESLVKVVGVRTGKPTTKHPIALMARNIMPATGCIECGESASMLCTECIYEDGEWGALCEKHVKTHPHSNYGDPIPLVNSPRLGVCGYEGPAKPPY